MFLIVLFYIQKKWLKNKCNFFRWKLDPAQAIVQVKEGNTALPFGVLAVKGYDVTGSVTSFGSPISGLYVLLYSKEVNISFDNKLKFSL